MSIEAFPKILVWTRFGPDFPSGSPAILAEILRRAPADKVEVVAEYRSNQDLVRTMQLPYPVHRYQGFRLLWPFKRGTTFLRWAMFLTFPLMVIYGLYRIRRFRPQCLVTIYAFTHWIFSSYLLSLISGVPVVFYVHDPYLERMGNKGWLMRRFAAWLENRCLRHATVVVLFETLQERYFQRYGIDSHVIRHPALKCRSQSSGNRAPSAEFVIGFAGTIYENNSSLLASLIRVTGAAPHFRVMMWTDAKPRALERLGLPQEHVTIGFESDYDRLLDKLGECDLLYLPLSFDDDPNLPRDSLNCVLPTKSTDYLQTRRPILVHCPASYELSRFFTSRRAAHVLNDDDPAALSACLTRLRSGAVVEPEADDIEAALAEFSPDEKAAAFFDVIRAASGVAGGNSVPSPARTHS